MILIVIYALLISIPEAKKTIKFKEKNYIYIYARGTRGKQNMISKNFNIIDSNITHIGIGININSKIEILSINSIKNTNALVLDNLTSYISEKDVFHYSIWRANCSNDEYKKAKKLFTEYKLRYINFDFDFDLKNESLYCSEFCWKFLSEINTKRFFYKPTIKKIENILFSQYFKANYLTYIPVDFFEINDKFLLIDTINKII